MSAALSISDASVLPREDVSRTASSARPTLTLPRPVEPGDAFALETGPLMRVVGVVAMGPTGAIDCLVQSEPDFLPNLLPT